MLRILDKLICVLVAAPPLYIVYRFMRWYLKSEMESRLDGSDTELTSDPVD